MESSYEDLRADLETVPIAGLEIALFPAGRGRTLLQALGRYPRFAVDEKEGVQTTVVVAQSTAQRRTNCNIWQGWKEFSDGVERLIKMESVQVPKPLLELLLSLPSLPKENYGRVCTFGTQHDSSDTTGNEWSSQDLNGDAKNGTFVDYFPEVLEVLVMLLTRDDINPDWQLRALQALEGLVASSDAEMKAKVVHCPGALTGLLVLLANDNSPGFQVRSALIIKHLVSGNTRGDIEIKTKICDHPGALHGLVVSLTKDSNPFLQRNAAGALSILASGKYDCHSKTVLKFVLKELVIPLEDNLMDLGLGALASLNLGAGRREINSEKTEDVATDFQLLHMRWRMRWMRMDTPSVGEAFESLDTILEDFEEGGMGQDIEEDIKGNFCHFDVEYVIRDAWSRRQGSCYPLRPCLWRSGLSKKGKVAALPESKLSTDGSPSARPHVQLTNHSLPLEVLLTLLSKVFKGPYPIQQRKALQDLCDRTQPALDGQVASLLVRHNVEALKGLMSLLALPSLRCLARLALQNLASSGQEITATIVRLLVSLTVYTNPLRECAVWGLGSLAAESDRIRAEIVNQPGALKSIVALLRKNNEHHIRGATVMALRNLAAAGDGRIKTTICRYSGALDGLVSSLTVHEKTIELSWKISFGLQKNAALALGHLARGRSMKAMIINHPGALSGLVIALTNLWSPALRQNAAFALGNLAGGDAQTKAKIIDHPGVLRGLTLALTKDRNRSPALQQHAAFAVGNLAEGDGQAKAAIVGHPLALHFLMNSLSESTNPALQKNAARALGILATGESETKSKIVNQGGVLEVLEVSSCNHDNMSMRRSRRSSCNHDNIGMRRHLKWAVRNLADNDDVEAMAKTKRCGELWNALKKCNSHCMG